MMSLFAVLNNFIKNLMTTKPRECRSHLLFTNWRVTSSEAILPTLPKIFISAIIRASNFKFGIQLGFGEQLTKKQPSGPKLAEVRTRGASQKFKTPQLFLQPLKLATLNLVHNLRLESSLPINNFDDQNGRRSGLWSIQNIGTPYLFLRPLKPATSYLVYNLGLGSSLPRNNFKDQNRRGVWAREHPKNWDSLFISATVEASD